MPGRSPGARSGPIERTGSSHHLVQSAGEILEILPGRPPGTRAPREGPIERLAFDFFARASKTEMLRVAMDYREIIVLRTGMKAEPKPEAVPKTRLTPCSAERIHELQI